MKYNIKPKVDQAARDAFAAGAKSQPVESPRLNQTHQEKREKKSPFTSGFNWRQSDETTDLLEFVLANSVIKSKQKLLDDIILPELARRAEAIRQRTIT